MTRVAASQYAIELIETWEAYAAHLSAIVREAKEKGAELLLLPEYSAMTLTGQLPPDIRADLHRSIEELQRLIPPGWSFARNWRGNIKSSSSRVARR